MKAMIFAAGLGNRLKPITDKIPKALVPVNGKPMLEHVILKLKANGFTDLVINIHHFGEQIIDFLNAKDNFGVNIHISDERDYLLDTGGAIKKAQVFLQGDEPFLIHNVDILSNVNINEIYEKHLSNEATATLLVSERETSRYLLFNENRLCGWRNRDTNEIKSFYPDFDPSRYDEYAFAGIHVVSPDIFDWMDEWTGKFSIIHFYLSICAKATINGYIAEDLDLLDIGKTESLILAEQWLEKHS